MVQDDWLHYPECADVESEAFQRTEA